MRLKKLILHGFKSFADRTEFAFNQPVTAIVGPNGCGKSNVVDAFKWVLGEQSAKSLRGDAMLDVIFNGSGSRKAAGMAEVTLVFDNPTRDDGTRMLAIEADEVQVGRRLFRDGTSNYVLNTQSSRLKDIKELFLDTGVGVDAYSVIEQGRVAALLEANPAERRLIFEEAAGISKYKIKKKEAQRKLEKVEQNLLRVHDIVEEIEKQLRSVKLQAGKARAFQELSARLNELRLSYSLQEYHTLFTEAAKRQGEQDDLAFRLDDAQGNLAKSQNELAERRTSLESASQRQQSTQHELVQAVAQIESAKHRQDHAATQLAQSGEQIAGFKTDLESTEKRLAEATAQLEAESASLAQLTEDLRSKTSLIEQRQVEYRDGQLQLNQLSQAIEAAKRSVMDLMRRIAQVSSRLNAIEIERKNIASQQSRVGERRQAVVEETETLSTKKSTATTKLEEMLAAIVAQQEQLEAKKAESQAMGKTVAALTEHLGEAKQSRSGLVSRQKTLLDLEAKQQGVSEGVKTVLRQRDGAFSFVKGIVADVLRVDVEHATVVEAALDGRDQYLTVDEGCDFPAAREAMAKLEGRVNFVSFCASSRGTGFQPVLESPEGMLSFDSQRHGLEARATDAPYDWNQHPQPIRFAVDLVRVESEFALLAYQLLGKTIVVDSLTDAFELRRFGPAGYRFVTPAGEVLEADGTLRAGPLTAAMGLLSRRSEIDSLTHHIADVEGRIAGLTQQLSQASDSARALEAEQNDIRNGIYASNTVKVQLSSEIAQTNDRLNALGREQPMLDRELQQLFETYGKLNDEEGRLADQKSSMETQQAASQREADEKAEHTVTLAEQIKAWNDQLTAARVELGQVQEKQLACRSHVDRLSADKAEWTEQIARIAKSIASADARVKDVERDLQQAKHDEATLAEKRDALSARAEELAAVVAELKSAVDSLSVKVESFRAEFGEVESELHRVQLKLSETKVRLESLVQRTLDELQLDLPTKYQETLVAQAQDLEGALTQSKNAEAETSDSSSETAPVILFAPDGTNWDEVASEIKLLREKVQRLGNVNVDSIGELSALEERQTFLVTQVTDLNTGKTQLEELIEQINAESSVRFEQTFNAVRENFQAMFRKIFGGGSADIFLELEVDDPEARKALAAELPQGSPLPVMRKTVDPLDAGIEILAKPPGKKPVSISQLSGGEKAMTCIALLMSIFKCKPSPFCILDEVDAPLDEANNVRFGMVVQEFLDQSQFIIITHHKRTMQIADLLYGVTQQEQGVSKRVAVKFDQVAQGGAIDQKAIEAAKLEEVAAA